MVNAVETKHISRPCEMPCIPRLCGQFITRPDSYKYLGCLNIYSTPHVTYFRLFRVFIVYILVTPLGWRFWLTLLLGHLMWTNTFKVYNWLSRRQQVTIYRVRTGYQYQNQLYTMCRMQLWRWGVFRIVTAKWEGRRVTYSYSLLTSLHKNYILLIK